MSFCPQCGARQSGLGGSRTEETTDPPGGGPPLPFARRREQGGFQASDEESGRLLWAGSVSGRAMIGHWLLAALVSVAAIVLASRVPPFERRDVVFGGVILLVWLVPILRLLYWKISIRYTLSGERLFHERGILLRTTNRVEVIDVDDVTIKQSILGRMLNVGTIAIKSSDKSHPELKLVGIADPMFVAELIDQTRRRERTRRAVYIEQV